MPFHSILFDEPQPRGGVEARDVPACFRDLNLDQVIEALIVGREEYNLAPFFSLRLPTVDAVEYRHEVFKDLEAQAVAAQLASFAAAMRDMRTHLARAGELHHTYEQGAWFLDAVSIYCRGVTDLARDLAFVDLRSRGLRRFRDYLTSYTSSERFTTLADDAAAVASALASVRYCLTISGVRISVVSAAHEVGLRQSRKLSISGTRVTVSRYDAEPDFSADVERTFEKFRQGDVKDYLTSVATTEGMDHVEAQILDRVALLFPETFSTLETFCARHREYLDPTLATFDREVQFYVAYGEFMAMITSAGLSFCYPDVSDQSKEISGSDTFDVALANLLVRENAAVVCNDFQLRDPERIMVVSGPNQGGKTTFARTFGQLHYLASLGCPVPGTDARLFLGDELFTHFEREEDITNLSSKLEDELLRIHEILERATGESIVVMNESFTSTTLRDALVLGTTVIRQMIERDLLCVYVTFVDELASLSETTVSMVSTVIPDNPAQRTYKIVRRPADGLAYAAAIAEKHGLTYARVKERLAP